MHAYVATGIIFSLFHVVVAIGGFYFLYQITKSLKRIADHLDNK